MPDSTIRPRRLQETPEQGVSLSLSSTHLDWNKSRWYNAAQKGVTDTKGKDKGDERPSGSHGTIAGHRAHVRRPIVADGREPEPAAHFSLHRLPLGQTGA